MTADDAGAAAVPPEVAAYIDGLPPEHLELFLTLQRTILEAAPDVRVVLSYKLPTYIGPAGRVSLSSGRDGVSIVTVDPEPIRRFTATHPDLPSGKVSVRFEGASGVPLADVGALVRDAVSGLRPAYGTP